MSDDVVDYFTHINYTSHHPRAACIWGSYLLLSSCLVGLIFPTQLVLLLSFFHLKAVVDNIKYLITLEKGNRHTNLSFSIHSQTLSYPVHS